MLVRCLLIMVGLYHACNANTINCSNTDCYNQTLTCDSNEECNVLCTNHYTCMEARITCSDEYPCNIYCNSDDNSGGCRETSIQCPSNSDCNVFCGTESQSCYQTRINATTSNTLSINECDGDDVCNSMYVSCPANGKNGNCYIGGDSLWMTFYLKGMDFGDIVWNYTGNSSNLDEWGLGNAYCDIGQCQIMVDEDNTPYCDDCNAYDNSSYYINCGRGVDCEGETLNCADGGGEEPCVVICDDWYNCQEAHMKCNDNYDCNVDCALSTDEGGSCREIKLDCPENADCVIDCGWNSQVCLTAEINARHSTSLRVLNCFADDEDNDDDDDYSACADMSVVCPETGICYFEGDDRLSSLKVWVDDTNSSFDNLVFNYNGSNKKEWKLGKIYCGYGNKANSCNIQETDPLECKGSCTESDDNNGGGNGAGDDGCLLQPINGLFVFYIVFGLLCVLL